MNGHEPCITFQECQILLKKLNPKSELLDYKLEKYSTEILGYLGDHLLLTLITKDGINPSFFVKNLQTKGLIECFSDQDFYGKEVFVYQFLEEVKEVLPKVDINIVPKLFYSRKDEVIVLENLGLDGYKSNDSIKYDKNHMLLALDTLAKFHAVTIAYEEFTGASIYDKYKKFFSPFFTRDENCSGHKYINSSILGSLKVIDLTSKDKVDAIKRKICLEKYYLKFLKILNSKNNFRKVLAHGDFWGNNGIFKYELGKPIDCKLVDFQLMRYAPPAHDVTMIMYHGSDPQNFQKYSNEYYDYYYKKLSQELKILNLEIEEILPYQEYKTTCDVYMKVAKLIWSCYRQTSEAKPENFQLLVQSNVQEIVIGPKRPEMIEQMCQIDNYYKTQLGLILDDVSMAIKYDDVSVEDCFYIIEKKIGHKNYKFKNYTMQPLSNRSGYLGEHYEMTIEYLEQDQIKTIDCFIKFLPTLESHKEFIYNSGMFYKELNFFTKIIPDFLNCNIQLIKDVAPHCHLASFNGIILENLSKLNFKITDPREPMSLDKIKIDINTIAKLHASGIIYEEMIKKSGDTRCLNEIYPKEFAESFYTTLELSKKWLSAGKTGLQQLIKLFSNHTSSITPKEFYNRGCKIIDDYPLLTQPSKKYRNTITHGDLWSNNMMTNFKNTILVDFQSYRYQPPGFDLMQYIYLSTSMVTREESLGEILAYYYDQLSGLLKEYNVIENVISFDEFVKSCEDGKVFAVMQTITHFQNTLMREDRRQVVFSDADLSKECFFGNRESNVKFCVESDEVYRDRIKEAMVELRRLCESFV